MTMLHLPLRAVLGGVLLVPSAMTTDYRPEVPRKPATSGEEMGDPPVGTLVFHRHVKGEPFRLWSIDLEGRGEAGVATRFGPSTDASCYHPMRQGYGERVVYTRRSGDAVVRREVGANGLGDRRHHPDSNADRDLVRSPDGRFVVWAEHVDGEDEDLFLLEVGGDPAATPRRLTRGGGDDLSPRWSPDGQRIVFRSNGVAAGSSGGMEVCVLELATGDVRAVTADSAFTNYASFSPDGRCILFRSNRDGNHEIYHVDLDGGVPTRVTDDAAYDGGPVWSPDGRWIAFESDRSGDGTDLWIVRPDGSDPRRITATPGIAEGGVAWLPPLRERLAFASKRFGPHADIVMVSPNGSDLVRLTDSGAHDRRPRISPDGAWIAFESHRDGQAEIYQMRVDGSCVENLTQHESTDLGADWHPHGDRVVFSSDRAGDFDLYLLDLVTKRVEVVLDTEADAWRPTFSPDGGRIAFQSNRSGSEEVWMLDLESGYVAQWTDAEGRDGWPMWSPDGSTLLYFSEREGVSAVFRTSAEGGGPAGAERLTPLDASSFFAGFSPDGLRVAFSREFDDHGTWPIWVMDADGRNPRELVGGPGRNFQVHWSSVRMAGPGAND